MTGTGEVDGLVFPFKPGDWVVSESEQVAQVKSVWDDRGELLADLIFYARDGRKVGRISPIMGGPRTFEPACPVAGWSRIKKPQFPLTLHAVPIDDGIVFRYWAGDRLPDREWIKPVRKSRKLVSTDFDPELEARARIMAAQMLRDTARELQLPALVNKAETLEREARTFSR